MKSRDLFKHRESIFSMEKKCGLEKFSEIEKSIIEFMAQYQYAHIDMIIKHTYFYKASLSTINRAVKKLKQEGVIQIAKVQSEDRRIVLLELELELEQKTMNEMN